MSAIFQNYPVAEENMRLVSETDLTEDLKKIDVPTVEHIPWGAP
jgi:hypothetical protein